ncbi:hypothetical protein JW899_01475 [Candidatus Uhrbacteria bacterium]|nr:hypothetical protein [Candidatus Uhrbacteria bacterium]
MGNNSKSIGTKMCGCGCVIAACVEECSACRQKRAKEERVASKADYEQRKARREAAAKRQEAAAAAEAEKAKKIAALKAEMAGLPRVNPFVWDREVKSLKAEIERLEGKKKPHRR